MNVNIELLINKIITKADLNGFTLNEKYNDVAVVIPTNRHDFLIDTLTFYNVIGCRNIYLLDTHPDKLDLNKIKFRFSYIHSPNLGFSESIKSALLDFIDEDFVCMVPDDDFVNPLLLSEGINFLKANQNYSLFYGQHKSFDTDSEGIPVFNNITEKYNRELSKSLLRNIIDFHKPYVNCAWTLSRKEYMIQFYENIHSLNLSNANLWELSIGLTALNIGKVFISGKIWIFRRIVPNSWGRQHRSIWLPFHTKSTKKDIHKFKNFFNKKYSNLSGTIYLNFYIFIYRFAFIKLLPKRILKRILEKLNFL